MSHSRELKHRLQTVGSTQKVVKVMKLMSVTYVRRMLSILRASSDSVNVVGKILSRVIPKNRASMGSLFSFRTVRTRVFLVITANKGLCGQYNSAVIKKAYADINRAIADGEKCQIICIGRKGYLFMLKRYGDMVVDSLPLLHRGKLCSSKDMVELCKKMAEMYVAEGVDAIDVIYTKYDSSLSMVPTTFGLLPLRLYPSDSMEAAEESDFDEPRAEFVNLAARQYLAACLYNIMAHAYLSEETSRMVTMDGAERNTKQLISDLKKQINRSRQATITSTLIDIINSSEAS